MKKRSMIAAALCLALGAPTLFGCAGDAPAPPASEVSSASETARASDTGATGTAAPDVTSTLPGESEIVTVPATGSAAPDAPGETEIVTASDTTPAPDTAPAPDTTPAATSAPQKVTAPETEPAAPSDTTEAAQTNQTTKTEEVTQPVELIEIPNSAQNAADYFSNPYRSINHIGDPFVLYDEASGKYYMYCTGGKFKCWSSDSFSSWTYEGEVYTATDKSFGTQSYWAPEVYKWNGAYYMVYSAARPAEESLSTAGLRHSIGLAKADSPAGPFTDVYDHPLYAPDYSVIDASLLFDDDGKIYLFYAKDCSENVVDGKKTSQVFGIELASDLGSTVGEPVLLATPTAAWEKQSGSTLWNEGPCVFKQNGTYYLLFTANYYASAAYSVGYATSASPLGTYQKAAENPILRGDGVYTSGTGHCSVTRSPDGTEMYMVYHSHADVAETTNPIANRTPCFDKLTVRPDGRLAVSGASVAMQPIPSGANGLYKKYDGVTATSSLRTLSGSVESLLDGVVPFGRTDADSIYRFADGDGCITLAYDTPIKLHSLWIYGMSMVQFSPKNVYAVINGTYKTKVRHFSASIALTPVVLTFDGLPEGTEVSRVDLYFTCADSAGNSAAVSEVITVAKK